MCKLSPLLVEFISALYNIFSHSHILTFAYLHIFQAFSYLHICTFAHLHICTFAHLHICTFPKHSLICTFAHLHINQMLFKRNTTNNAIVPSRARQVWWWVRPYVVLICLIVCLRLFIISPIVLPGNRHALVSLTYYGLRVPGEQMWGYHRWGYRVPAKHDEVVFTCSDTRDREFTLTGRCQAGPGETIWIDPVRQIVIPGRTSPDAQPIRIPAHNSSIRVTPYNARILAYLMQHYEHCNNVRVNRFGQLEMDGQTLSRVRLLRDYFWIEMRPDSFLLIPHDNLVGKVLF